MKPAQDDDSTIRVVPKPPPPLPSLARKKLGWPLVGAVIIAVGLGTLGWAMWPRATLHYVVLPEPTARTVTVALGAAHSDAPEFLIQQGTEEQIFSHVSTGLSVFRFVPNPRILVLDFASLQEQGLMLNRIGAMAEKATLPRDRVLTDAELAKAIQAGGDTVESFYYGHDYSAATLARFFALADRDHIQLSKQEDTLRRLLRQEGWFTAGLQSALISIPRVGADAKMTLEARRTILHHELSHGEYFSNPEYAAYVHRFWRSVLTPRECDAVRKHLRSEAYDSDLDDLMENEMQAYLMFTHNPIFFTPAMVNMTPARLEDLKVLFMRTLPVGWLRDVAPNPLAAPPIRSVAH